MLYTILKKLEKKKKIYKNLEVLKNAKEEELAGFIDYEIIKKYDMNTKLKKEFLFSQKDLIIKINNCYIQYKIIISNNKTKHNDKINDNLVLLEILNNNKIEINDIHKAFELSKDCKNIYINNNIITKYNDKFLKYVDNPELINKMKVIIKNEYNIYKNFLKELDLKVKSKILMYFLFLCNNVQNFEIKKLKNLANINKLNSNFLQLNRLKFKYNVYYILISILSEYNSNIVDDLKLINDIACEIKPIIFNNAKCLEILNNFLNLIIQYNSNCKYNLLLRIDILSDFIKYINMISICFNDSLNNKSFIIEFDNNFINNCVLLIYKLITRYRNEFIHNIDKILSLVKNIIKLFFGINSNIECLNNLIDIQENTEHYKKYYHSYLTFAKMLLFDVNENVYNKSNNWSILESKIIIKHILTFKNNVPLELYEYYFCILVLPNIEQYFNNIKKNIKLCINTYKKQYLSNNYINNTNNNNNKEILIRSQIMHCSNTVHPWMTVCDDYLLYSSISYISQENFWLYTRYFWHYNNTYIILKYFIDWKILFNYLDKFNISKYNTITKEASNEFKNNYFKELNKLLIIPKLKYYLRNEVDNLTKKFQEALYNSPKIYLNEKIINDINNILNFENNILTLETIITFKNFKYIDKNNIIDIILSSKTIDIIFCKFKLLIDLINTSNNFIDYYLLIFDVWLKNLYYLLKVILCDKFTKNIVAITTIIISKLNINY